MERIGVFGGLFDPPHLAHLIHARLILEMLDLDKVIFVPAANPPHKEAHASFTDRAQMTRLAIEGDACFEVSEIEWKENISYTVDTLTSLKILFPESELFLIIGRDEYDCLNTWREPERIMKSAELVILPRGSKSGEQSKAGMHFPNLPLIEISSCVIRQRVASGKPIHNWVPPKVESYIRGEELYKESS